MHTPQQDKSVSYCVPTLATAISLQLIAIFVSSSIADGAPYTTLLIKRAEKDHTLTAERETPTVAVG
jgi:hypothetical protein